MTRLSILTAIRRLNHSAISLLRSRSSILIGSNGISLVTRIISTIILTRLLDSSAFGAIGLIMTFSFVLSMITDLGFYQFVVRSEKIKNPEFLDRVWTVRFCRDLVLAIVMVLMSGSIASYVRVPELQLAFAISALTVILDGACSMAFATAAHSQKIGMLSLLDLICSVVTTIVSIVMAIYMRSYWAIIIGILVGSLLKTILSYSMFPGSSRRFVFDPNTFREVWQFGRFIMPSSVITLIINQSDKIVLARVFDIKTFGLYSIASNLAIAPLSLMNSYTARILYPAFASGFQTHPTMMKDLFYKVGFLVRALFMFVAGGSITGAPIVIASLYDNRYIDASSFLSVLLITSVVNFIITTENELLVAMGKVRLPLYFNMLRLVVLILVGPLLFWKYNAIGLVWSFAIAGIITQLAMSIKMHSLGLFRLRSEFTLWSSGGLGMFVGYFSVLVASKIWANIPLPFSS